MAGEMLRRPSVLVGAWIAIVVTVFVVRGDLRIALPAAADTASANPDANASAAKREAVVVRRAPSPRAPSPATVLRGRVFDALGFLVVGAEVVPENAPPRRTDADGSFQLEIAAAAVADVLVGAEGLRSVWLRTSAGSPDALALQLVPKAPWDQPPSPLLPIPALRAEGHARGEDGRPLADAFVTARGGGVWARTDDIGRFVLPLPAMTATLLVHAPDGGAGGMGLIGESEPFVSPRAQGAVPVPDVIASAGAGIRGIVRDARGQPAAGVPVRVKGDALQRIVEAGPGGEFRVGGLSPGRYEAQPFAYRGDVGVKQEIALDHAAVDIDLQLVAADEVRLRVVDERGGAVGGVWVAASIGGARRGVARADDEGYASVPVAADTDFDVRMPPEYSAMTVRQFDAEPPTLVVTRQ